MSGMARVRMVDLDLWLASAPFVRCEGAFLDFCVSLC